MNIELSGTVLDEKLDKLEAKLKYIQDVCGEFNENEVSKMILAGLDSIERLYK